MNRTPLRCLLRSGWNRRILTIEDFYTLTETAHITLIERPLAQLGYYAEPHGNPLIVLNSTAPPLAKLHAAWHEFGHALFHTPGNYGNPAKTEFEADIIADCALIPFPLLYTYTHEQLMADYDYPRWLVERRARLFNRLNL